MKLWEKGYKLNKKIEEFTVGNDYVLDQRLVRYDCFASIAHAKMLGKIGILNEKEVNALIKELKKIIELDKKNKFTILKEQEDCHTAIENYLTKNLGKLGKKIHTARSRNDQVLTALRLYYKDELKNCKKLVDKLIGTISKFSNKFGNINLPGYTHSRKAMPSSIKMWSNSFIESMKDNLSLIDAILTLIDQSPLGTGAGYGLPLEIDRNYTAKILGFKKVQINPIYAQNSRGKFESSILHALSQILFDINKIATDLIIFSMDEFGYFILPRKFCTGSSIMPQKKNPDVLELLRANYHVIVSQEFLIKNISGNLISGYNRDLQLTEESMIKSFDITSACLDIAGLIFRNLKVNAENCKRGLTSEIYATKKVYDLVKTGKPFRQAYKIISEDF